MFAININYLETNIKELEHIKNTISLNSEDIFNLTNNINQKYQLLNNYKKKLEDYDMKQFSKKYSETIQIYDTITFTEKLPKKRIKL